VRRDVVGVGKGMSAPGREGMGGMAAEERDRAEDTDVQATGISPSARFPGETDEFSTNLIGDHAAKGSSG
jgi:hypothetical protein